MASDNMQHLKLVQLFPESEADLYFCASGCTAGSLNCEGKCEEVCTSLSAKDRFNCEIVTKTVVHTYELVPEAYQHTFKNSGKSPNQIFVVW